MKEEGVSVDFPLRTNESYTNRTTGERVENTEWHNVVVRNKAAEICEKYLKKGDKVYIEGRIKTRKWQDDQGNERYSTEIQCTDFTFLSPRGEGMGAPMEQRGGLHAKYGPNLYNGRLLHLPRSPSGTTMTSHSEV